jgi:hypothetical protein
MLPHQASFPHASWTLHGDAIVATKLVPKDLAGRFIPERAILVSVWPGHALAILYIARYRDSPVGE